MQIKAIALSAMILGLSVNASACEDDCLLASRGDIKVYAIDVEASLGDLSPAERAGVLMKQDRVDRIMDNVLIMRQLAEMAKAQGLDTDPLVQREMLLAAERTLAEHARAAEMKRRLAQSDFEAYALEQYAIRSDEFSVPPVTEVLHILVSTQHLCQADALARAQEILGEAKSGADFGELVTKYSDDGSKDSNGGRIEVAARSDLDPAFSSAANALQKPGELSEPVRSTFGYHIIKLVEKRPGSTPTYEQVKPALMQNLTANYERRVKDTFLSDLRSTEPSRDEEALREFRARFTPKQ